MLAGDRPVDASTTFRMRLAVHSPRGLKYYSDSRHNWEVPVIELKVRKVGNSLGVVLPKAVVSRLQTHEGATLFLSETPEGGYRLTPYDPDFEDRMAKAEDLMLRYRDTLHVLAK